MIRDQIKMPCERAKASAVKDKPAVAKVKAREPAPIKLVAAQPKAASKITAKSAVTLAPAKRRVKKPAKPADIPTAS